MYLDESNPIIPEMSFIGANTTNPGSLFTNQEAICIALLVTNTSAERCQFWSLIIKDQQMTIKIVQMLNGNRKLAKPI